MNAKLDKALNRLTSILPLKERQDECSSQIRELHRRILLSFVEQGRIPTREEMGRHVDDLEEAVNTLAEKDMVVFSRDGTPLGAYPFTMEDREHAVQVNGHRVHAMCALDALAVAPMFGVNTQVSSRCRLTGAPVGTSCANSLCLEMMFLKSGEIAWQWFMEDPDNREVFTLKEAVEFGDQFFAPLMA